MVLPYGFIQNVKLFWDLYMTYLFWKEQVIYLQ